MPRVNRGRFYSTYGIAQGRIQRHVRANQIDAIPFRHFPLAANASEGAYGRTIALLNNHFENRIVVGRLSGAPDSREITEDIFMKTGLIAAFAGGAMMVLTVPAISMAQNTLPSAGVNANAPASAAPIHGAAIPSKITPDYLLNRASRMNHEEEHMMNLAVSKAGDNQALKTLATTISDDHKANESAVKALASQENVNLNNNNNNRNAAYNRLNNLNGAAFNEAFLNSQIRDHEQALRLFKEAEKQPQSRAMKTYINETMPVLRAHLQMARNLKEDMLAMGSPENPANNKQNNGNSNYANSGH